MSQKIGLSWETTKKILEMILQVEKDIKEKVKDGNNLLEKYLENIDEIIKKFNRRLCSEEFEFIELTENEYNSFEKLFAYQLVQLNRELYHTKFGLQKLSRKPMTLVIGMKAYINPKIFILDT